MDNVHIILGAPKEEAIKPLIKENGLVIGVDRGALIALEEEIEVDLALGDFDSISKNEKALIQNEAKEMMDFPSDKDDTDAELALLYASKKYPSANIYFYNWYGGRVDHLYSILLLALQERFEEIVSQLHFVSETNYITYFLPGQHDVYKIDQMEYLSYVLLTEVEDLTLNQVKYTLDDHSFSRPTALISNEFINEKASFSFSKGIIAVVQSRD